MMGTQIAREVDSVLYTRAGPEMAVAASKTFTAQVALLYLIALKLAQVRRTLPEEEIASLLDEVHGLPDKIEEFLDGTIRSRRSPSATTTSRSSSTSAATSGCPSASRARSS